MSFGFPDEIDPVILPGEPEWSYFSVALSLLLPYLEPYLIRTMKEAKKHVTDPDLLADLAKFSGQEGQHYRQHMLFNDTIRGFGFPKLNELEQELEADYQRFSESKSLRWNLAYAEGFEALTTAAARYSFEMDLNSRLEPRAVRDLMSWHLIEELEHRTMAFDVYAHLYGGYAYRLLFATYGQWHMSRWLWRAARYMLEEDPRIDAEFGGAAGRRMRVRAHLRSMRKHLLPKALQTYLPWYTPHDIPMTQEMKQLAAEYTKSAVRTG
jgi:predicted metal-dependent hydrolase